MDGYFIALFLTNLSRGSWDKCSMVKHDDHSGLSFAFTALLTLETKPLSTSFEIVGRIVITDLVRLRHNLLLVS